MKRKFGEVVQIELLRRKKSKDGGCTCISPRFLLDNHTDLVTCQSCEAVMSARVALEILGEKFEILNSIQQQRMDQLEAAAAELKPEVISPLEYIKTWVASKFNQKGSG